jgi:hypothetical protein
MHTQQCLRNREQCLRNREQCLRNREQCIRNRERAALQRRASDLESVRALAPVIAFVATEELFSTLPEKENGPQALVHFKQEPAGRPVDCLGLTKRWSL